MRFHEISVRDPVHERNAAAQSAQIAKWVSSRHPTVEAEVICDQFKRHVVIARCPEHGMAHDIRYEVAMLFPSQPMGAAATKRKVPGKKCVPLPPPVTKACAGFYVVQGDWRACGFTGKAHKGIRAAQKALKALKGDSGAVAHVVEVGKTGVPHPVETWIKARTLWHSQS